MFSQLSIIIVITYRTELQSRRIEAGWGWSKWRSPENHIQHNDGDDCDGYEDCDGDDDDRDGYDDRDDDYDDDLDEKMMMIVIKN